MDQDLEYLVSKNDLRVNVKTFTEVKNTESEIRKELFRRDIQHTLKDKFNNINFLTLSNNGETNVNFYRVDDPPWYWEWFCCCCCLGCDPICRRIYCGARIENCGNIIEQYFPFLFKIVKKDINSISVVRGLNDSETLDVIESVLEELIQGSNYDLTIHRGGCSIFIKW